MVHHSIAVVFTSFLTNFLELRKAEVGLLRINLPHTAMTRACAGLPMVQEAPHPTRWDTG